MELQLSKYWLLTSPHGDVPKSYPGLTASFSQAARPVWDMYKSLLDGLISDFEKRELLYDSIVSVEDGDHIHAYIECSQPVSLYGYIERLPGWNIQLIPEEDARIQGAKDYVRKNGFWKQKVDELPDVYADPSPEWRPWQIDVLERLAGQNDREILYVYDKRGNHGKSYLASWFACRRRASYIPATLKTSRDLLRVALDRPNRCYFVDFPKCVTKTSIPQVFAAVESIKNGHVYDDRYEYRDAFMNHPAVCVFGNFEPDRSMLSADRWDVKYL